MNLTENGRVHSQKNAEDAFMVADTRKSDRSCLPINDQPDSFVQDDDGVPHLEFHYTKEDTDRNLRM